MIRLFAATCLALLPMGAMAKEPLSEKFEVKGSVLIYDTEKLKGEIRDEDIDALKQVLNEHSGITELRLNSTGGSVYAGSEMAWIVMDYGLDTRVDGECISACIDLFLAGKRRRMTFGSKLGFHHRSWGPKAVQNYYREWRKRKDWATPFEFGAWIYGDTQAEIYEHLTFMVSRGVDPGFAIKSMQAISSEEWYPSRLQLIAAGVLREEAPED
ncbi:hypothetical protein [Pseudophaeobacter sp.]